MANSVFAIDSSAITLQNNCKIHYNCSVNFSVVWNNALSLAAEGVCGWGGTMASAEHEPITGVWGRAPSGVHGQRGAKPL